MTTYTIEAITKLGATAKTIKPFEAGALNKIATVETNATKVINALIEALWTDGIRGNDWRAKAGLDSIKEVSEAHTAAYSERLEFYGKACYTPSERAELALPSLKLENFPDEGAFLKAGKARKKLQDRPSTQMKNFAKRFDTKSRQAGELADAATTPATPKLGIDVLGQKVVDIINLLQGDKPFPDSFLHDEAIAQMLGFQNIHNLPK